MLVAPPPAGFLPDFPFAGFSCFQAPTGAPGSSSQSGQNHSPSGTADRGGVRHERCQGESHYTLTWEGDRLAKMVEKQIKEEDTIRYQGKEVKSRTDLIAFQGGVILSIILSTFHTVRRCIDLFRMSWEVVEFLVWLGKQQGCILAGCNAVIEKSD